jgi:hypothetical protein
MRIQVASYKTNELYIFFTLLLLLFSKSTYLRISYKKQRIAYFFLSKDAINSKKKILCLKYVYYFMEAMLQIS